MNDTQTVFLEKVKKQGKYVEYGYCGYCGEEVSTNRSQRYCDEECEDLAKQVGGECVYCGQLTQESSKFCSRGCALIRIRELTKEIKRLEKEMWL